MWSVPDWRSDDVYDVLDNREKGMYRELIDQCWVAGSITSNPEALARFVHEPMDFFVPFWAKVSRKFRSLEGGERLVSKRLEEDRDRLKRSRLKKVKAGKKGGKESQKRRKNLTNNIQPINNLSSTASPVLQAEHQAKSSQIQNQTHKESLIKHSPHQQHSPSLKSIAADEYKPGSEFVEKTIALYLALPCTPNRATGADGRVAAEMERREIPIEAVECGILQVGLRNTMEHRNVSALVYFVSAIEEAATKPIPRDFIKLRRQQLAEMTKGKNAEEGTS